MEIFEKKLRGYLEGPFVDISGACNPRVLVPTQGVFQLQSALGIRGSVAEIGVRDGRYFIGLASLCAEDEKLLAIDLFEDQHQNLDGSGFRPPEHGVPFHDNVRRLVTNPERVVSHKADSLGIDDQTISQFQTQFGPFRCISIDGGHTREHTVNDLSISDRLLAHGGVAILDDYYNPNWPGVHEGFGHWMRTQNRRLAPFMFSSGKLFLCNYAYHAIYVDGLLKYAKSDPLRPYLAVITRRPMFGYDAFHFAVTGPGTWPR